MDMNIYSNWLRQAACLFACCMLLAGVASAQQEPIQGGKTAAAAPPQKAGDAVEKLKQGDFSSRDVDEIAKAAPAEAIPAL